MNRKLRNTILAFSVTGMVLVAGLMAAHPVMPGQPAQSADATAARTAPAPGAAPATGPVLSARRDAAAARSQARGTQAEAALVDPRAIEQAAALTVDLVTAALAGGFRAAQAEEAGAEAAGRTANRDDDAHASKPRRNRSRSVRREIAVPYFSFARGTGDRS